MYRRNTLSRTTLREVLQELEGGSKMYVNERLRKEFCITPVVISEGNQNEFTRLRKTEP